MGIMVYSLLWVMQDSYHQPYFVPCFMGFRVQGFRALRWASVKLQPQVVSTVRFRAAAAQAHFDSVHTVSPAGRLR